MRLAKSVALLFLLLASIFSMAGDTIIYNYPNVAASCSPAGGLLIVPYESGGWGPLSPYKCTRYNDDYLGRLSTLNDAWGCVTGGFRDELPGAPLLEEIYQFPPSIGCYRVRDYYPLTQIEYDVTSCSPVLGTSHWMYFQYIVQTN